MTKIAITGHRGLPPDVTALVDAALQAEVGKRDDGRLTGISCLADGPDSLFAQAVLERGGELVVVVPAHEYRDSLPTEHHAVYDELRSAATKVIELDRDSSDPEAHQAGSERMLDEADELLAVWDGKPARGYGGTADVVAAARERGIPVTVIWPDGATRD
ncbi:hypothetical protein [Nocardia cyriacigeorgica]|uniref:DUF1273 domain-containing protein n=1 Tax=Nocardia cyriacigeorgica TaxID=135487 RepID=A0A5R8NFI9_9NOCA|nr:hypothetical protein [Nocardia cyriacigeorgica]TLF74364.1 hypothetical protein FEK34_23550 [Nocardia cyriacigeorgica]